MSVMAVMKGLPTTYNKDLQECWPIMFETVDTMHDCLQISTGILSTLVLKPEKMLQGHSSHQGVLGADVEASRVV